MTIDRRFALIDQDDVRRYPYKKTERATGNHGFAIGKKESPEFTEDIERVIREVVLNGSAVRVKTDDPKQRKEGLLSLHAQQEIKTYWLAPEFLHLVEGAKFRPIKPSAAGATSRPLEAESLGRLTALTQQDYTAAYEALDARISDKQLAMLVGHASAADHTLTMTAIAEFGGYGDHKAANTQYSKLGRLFADHFGISNLESATQAIAIAAPPDADGHWQWTLRPALVQALVHFGLVEGVIEIQGRGDAQREVDVDPKTKGISETTRQALINARIGQGGYRQRMLRLWGGKCAFSGCAIESVLVASHAKAWADSSNDERLDKYNGLLLAASIDKLFDKGLISFADDGTLLVSSEVSDEGVASVGLNRVNRLRFLHARHKPYLSEHRKRFGFEQ